MYKYHHSELPAVFDQMVTTNDNIRTVYQVPIYRLESKRNSLCFVGVVCFNTIFSPSNNDIIYTDSIHGFKRTLKESSFISINIS